MSKFVSLVALVVCVFGSAVGQKKITTIADLGRMAGCWERREPKNELLVTEQWMSPAGTSILGMGRTVKKEKTVDYEFMRIEQREDGLYFVAQPKANTTETAFKLIRSSNKEIVFENKDHDFPQRVIYKLSGRALTGRIEGISNSRSIAIDFPMNRVECTQ